MSILADKPTHTPLAGKCGGAQVDQKSSVFPNLRSPDEIGRASPQRPLVSLWAELRYSTSLSYPKPKSMSETETRQAKDTALGGIFKKVAKLYCDFKAQRND